MMAQGFWDIRVAPLEKPLARIVGVIPTLSISLLYSGSNITDSFLTLRFSSRYSHRQFFLADYLFSKTVNHPLSQLLLVRPVTS